MTSGNVAVISDVHAGALPRETCDALMALDGARFVRGNADREMAAGGHPDLDELVRESLVEPIGPDEVARYFEGMIPSS